MLKWNGPAPVNAVPIDTTADPPAGIAGGPTIGKQFEVKAISISRLLGGDATKTFETTCVQPLESTTLI
ncbi:hypothetical protein D3C87_1257850 [compost metagenome]